VCSLGRSMWCCEVSSSRLRHKKGGLGWGLKGKKVMAYEDINVLAQAATGVGFDRALDG